jgi:hypothetical protein
MARSAALASLWTSSASPFSALNSTWGWIWLWSSRFLAIWASASEASRRSSEYARAAISPPTIIMPGPTSEA